MTDQLAAVTEAANRLRAARQDLTHALTEARAAGHTYGQLGAAAGVARETIFKRLQRAAKKEQQT